MGKYSKKVFIEFIGVPGSGKTKLAREVSNRLVEEGFRCGARQSLCKKKDNFLYRVVEGICFLISHPIFIVRIFFFCYRSKYTKKYFSTLKNFISQHRVVCKDYSVIVYDQGVLNAVLYNTAKFTDFEYLDFLYKSFFNGIHIVLFFIDTDFNTAIKRAKSRPAKGHFTERFAVEKNKSVYENYLSNYRKLLSYNKDIFVVDGDVGILDNAIKIVDCIKRLYE